MCRISVILILKDGLNGFGRDKFGTQKSLNVSAIWILYLMETNRLFTAFSGAVSLSFVFSRSLSEMVKTEEIHWYPMRVTYSRELQAKVFLDSIGVESFIPMHYVHVEGKHPRHCVLKPAITSLIFVHSCQKSITELKMTKRELSSLRYIMQPILDDNNNVLRRDILTVPDRQMENFIKVASVLDDRVFYMENLDFAGKPGQRVKVIEGDFAGVEGIIKRVKKNKCVVVQIENVAAVAIAFLPAAFLLPLD